MHRICLRFSLKDQALWTGKICIGSVRPLLIVRLPVPPFV